MQSHFVHLKPMALDQVLSDRDSEDEVDDDIADLEDRRVYLTIIFVLHYFFFLNCHSCYNSRS